MDRDSLAGLGEVAGAVEALPAVRDVEHRLRPLTVETPGGPGRSTPSKVGSTSHGPTLGLRTGLEGMTRLELTQVLTSQHTQHDD